ncbi:AAA family ATPase [Stygiolobus sp. CP850M]|uniref:AAA family ATPase n=1 Tax=Stygiolobus sp. CP850M TaxID=3133134 RepID=UPI00307E90D5
MKLYLSNLGPIKHGEIELGDITLFVGKPNTGKSTAMKALFYSLYCPGNLIKLKQDSIEVKDNLFLLHFTIDREGTKENYKSFISDSLPEGEFKLEPINVLDFILTQKLSYEEEYRPSTLPPMFFPKTCSDEDMKRLRFSLSNTIYKISVNGDKGEVKVDVSDVSETCLKDNETLSSISTIMLNIAEQLVNSQYCIGFNESLSKNGINGVVYIPYGRSLLVLQKFILQEILNSPTSASPSPSSWLEAVIRGFIMAIASSPFKITGPNYLTEYFEGLTKYNEKVFNLIKPLLKGQIANVGGNLIYIEENKKIPWKYVSASILEIVSFLLSVKEESLVLFEEPETQLHEELQLLMGMVLYALSSINRIVISTHSQTIVSTIAHLSMLKPTKEELKDLFEDLKVKDYEALAEAVEKANEKVKVKVYHFTEGEVKDVSIDYVVRGLPGTKDVLEKEFRWFSSLHSKRLFGQK